MEIVNDVKNDLLKRKEITAFLESEKNPGIVSVVKEIAEKFKAQEEVVVIKSLKGKFGAHRFEIHAFIYDSVQDKEKIEPKKKEKKKAEEKTGEKK